ncbi:MAG: class I SAM-dependent methyltransferase [Desulfuromonadales bacterium]|nr:class I SAM-dependent methyltransferase [Desulfuromonadales bacterium]
MQLDPDNKYIQAIDACTPLTGATILEIGCGSGRMTVDMAKLAAQMVATDLDAAVLEQAKKNITATNVEFIHTPDGIPDLAKKFVDIVIYTLSLHHIPMDMMTTHLQHAGSLLRDNGKIVVVEPGDSGTFLEAKQRFGAGSGDETTEKQAAIAAMKNLDGWVLHPTHNFFVDFLFTDNTDFFTNKLPNYQNLPAEEIVELEDFLHHHTTSRGIILTSERYLNLLTKIPADVANSSKKPQQK